MGVHAGRHGRRFNRLRANLRARHDPCCRCGDPIDYGLEYPHPQSFSVDHFPYPLSTHPHLAEDPGNLAAAHLLCNQQAGNGKRSKELPPLGGTSEEW